MTLQQMVADPGVAGAIGACLGGGALAIMAAAWRHVKKIARKPLNAIEAVNTLRSETKSTVEQINQHIASTDEKVAELDSTSKDTRDLLRLLLRFTSALGELLLISTQPDQRCSDCPAFSEEDAGRIKDAQSALRAHQRSISDYLDNKIVAT